MALVFETLRRRGSIAALVLLGLVAGTFPLPHTEGLDDPDCLPVLVGHNESAHHFGVASATNAAPEHCFLCHSLRSFHQPHERFHQREIAVGSEPLHVTGPVAAKHSEWSPTAGRAPPRSI